MGDIQALYDEFEEFCTKYCGLVFDEFSIYQRKKLGHYFDVRDEYFKLWLNAKKVYQKQVEQVMAEKCESCKRKQLQLGGYMPCGCNKSTVKHKPPRKP